jgi:hypothetical protein
MLVQDMLTGRLHEVPAAAPAPAWPDPQVYGLGEVFDDRGQSLGLFLLPKLIRSIVGSRRPPPAPASPVVRTVCPPCPTPMAPWYPPGLRPGFPPYPPGYPGLPFGSRRRRRRRRR